MGPKYATVAYISAISIFFAICYLIFSIFILKSYNDSKYDSSCSKESKDKLDDGKNLTIGGIAFSVIVMVVFLIIMIVAIVYSIKSRTSNLTSISSGLKEFGSNLGQLVKPY